MLIYDKDCELLKHDYWMVRNVKKKGRRVDIHESKELMRLLA